PPVALDTLTTQKSSDGQLQIPSSDTARAKVAQSDQGTVADVSPVPPLNTNVSDQQATISAQSTLPAVVNSPNNLIKFKFRQDSWILLKRENGSVLTSHMAKAGTEESFDVKEVLQIKIGNAAGVDGTLRGVSLNIAPTKESNVFNLSVK
ncbi:DUF4115 domain-containing protein, partial [Undibacterium sp. RTI2.1]